MPVLELYHGEMAGTSFDTRNPFFRASSLHHLSGVGPSVVSAGDRIRRAIIHRLAPSKNGPGTSTRVLGTGFEPM